MHMKKIFFWLGFHLFVSAAFGQLEQTPNANSGLLNRLIEIKYTSELFLNNALQKGNNKDSALAIYNTIRWRVDAFVYALSADMIAGNSPRKMRLLNDWCLAQDPLLNQAAKSHQAIRTHALALQEIVQLYQEQIWKAHYPQSKTLNLTTNVFYLLKDSYTIVKGLSDMKTQKNMALIEILDHTRLLSPSEVGKGVK